MRVLLDKLKVFIIKFFELSFFLPLEPDSNYLKYEIKAQLIIIKKLWAEILDFHKNYEKETNQLVEELSSLDKFFC